MNSHETETKPAVGRSDSNARLGFIHELMKFEDRRLSRIALHIWHNRNNLEALTDLQCSLNVRPWTVSVLARVEMLCVRRRGFLMESNQLLESLLSRSYTVRGL